MLKGSRVAMIVAGVVAAAGLILVVDRGGVIAWAGLLLGVGLLLKAWRKPASMDAALGLGVVMVLALAWVGTRTYVISTWESGEVVELGIDTAEGLHTVRLWVMDVGPDPTVYYDAEPHAAESLLAGRPVRFTRGGAVSTKVPHATEVDDLPEDEAAVILEAMETKYGALNDAAIVYYVMLGRRGDRVSLVARLAEG